jgi:hypothetical protein
VTTIEGAIVSILNSNSGVTTLVSNRIAPATDPQNLPLPKLTYQRLRTDRDTESGGFSNSGPTGHAVATFQIDCWCQSLLTAKQTISAVRTALYQSYRRKRVAGRYIPRTTETDTAADAGNFGSICGIAKGDS